jgi:transposase InsO family protein
VTTADTITPVQPDDDFIEVFSNRRRRHSALDYASPVSYEQHHQAAPAA